MERTESGVEADKSVWQEIAPAFPAFTRGRPVILVLRTDLAVLIRSRRIGVPDEFAVYVHVNRPSGRLKAS